MSVTITMFAKQMCVLLVSTQFATFVHFPASVSSVVYGGGENELWARKNLQDGKIVTLKALDQKVFSNIIFTTAGGDSYECYVKYAASVPHTSVIIENGTKQDSDFVVKKSTNSYYVFEGNQTAKIYNRLDKPIAVNNQILSAKGEMFFPKGSPLFVDNERVQ